MNFAQQIVLRREMLHYTQAEMAEVLGVDKQTISNWETGRTVPWLKSQGFIFARLDALANGAPQPQYRANVCERI